MDPHNAPETQQNTEEVTRFDAVDLCGEPRFDAETGFCTLEGIAVTPGSMVYTRADGSTWTELVRADMLAATAPAIVGLPVTHNHPSPSPWVDTSNAAQVSKGNTVAAETLQDGSIKVRLVVRDAGLIAEIRRKGGPRGLSLGYKAALKRLGPGAAADAEQVSRRYNHLAVVPAGRSQGAVLRADSLDAAVTDSVYPEVEVKMKKIKIAGAEHEVSEQVAVAFEALVARADAADAKVAELTGANRVLEAQAEKLRADAADVATFDARVAARVELEGLAAKHHVKVVDGDKRLSDSDIKRALTATALRADAKEFAGVDGPELDGMFKVARRQLDSQSPRHPAYDKINAALANRSEVRADAAKAPLDISARYEAEIEAHNKASAAAGRN